MLADGKPLLSTLFIVSNNKLYTTIKRILEDYGVNSTAVTLQSSFEKDLGLDSLDYTELTMELEVLLEIDIPYDISEKVKTVVDLVNVVERIQREKRVKIYT